ncbi:MAG: hypothetical protein CMM43_08850 [Rhodospirillaceae bacterium]|nr:hypothetical protein [Rhodospirillaceae bacterium]
MFKTTFSILGPIFKFLKPNSDFNAGCISLKYSSFNLGNIINFKIISRSVDFFEMQIDVEVNHIKHLKNIIAALRATPVISSVERARG